MHVMALRTIRDNLLISRALTPSHPLSNISPSIHQHLQFQGSGPNVFREPFFDLPVISCADFIEHLLETRCCSEPLIYGTPLKIPSCMQVERQVKTPFLKMQPTI